MREMKTGSDESNGTNGAGTGGGGEDDEKERTIAKAALSIAELGQSFSLHPLFFRHQLFGTTRSNSGPPRRC
jgi:hypothetical protein